MAAIAGVYLLTITGFVGLFQFFDKSVENVTRDVVRELMDISQLVSFISGIIVADFAFGYLGSKKQHYLFETLPMNRKSMFANRFVFGYILLFIPNFFIFLIEIIQLAVITGEFVALPLLCWLLIIAGQNLFWLTFGILFMVLCGRKLMAFFCYFAFAGFGFVVEYTFAIFNPILFIGYESISDENVLGLGILSPIEYVYRFYSDDKDGFYGIEGYYGGGRLVTVFIAFAVLFIISYILYSKRKAERTGDNIVFPFMKIICSWCFTFVFSIELTLITLGLFASSTEGLSHYIGYKIYIIVAFIVFCVIGYMISCMIIEKKINIFKKYLKPTLICSGILGIAAILYISDVLKNETYVPKVEDVASVRVYGAQFTNEVSYFDHNNDDNMPEEKKRAGVELHEIIIDNMDELIEYYKKINGTAVYVTYDENEFIDEDPIYDVNSRIIYIDYVLKDGSKLYRRYYTKLEGKLYEEIKAFLQAHPDDFKKERAENYIY